MYRNKIYETFFILCSYRTTLKQNINEQIYQVIVSTKNNKGIMVIEFSLTYFLQMSNIYSDQSTLGFNAHY